MSQLSIDLLISDRNNWRWNNNSTKLIMSLKKNSRMHISRREKAVIKHLGECFDIEEHFSRYK